METVQQNIRFTLFLVNSSLYVLFSMLIDPLSWSTYGENLDFQAKLGFHAYDR